VRRRWSQARADLTAESGARPQRPKLNLAPSDLRYHMAIKKGQQIVRLAAAVLTAEKRRRHGERERPAQADIHAEGGFALR